MLFVLFGWSIRGFFFEIPSFLLYFGLGDIASILFYMMAFALLESFFVTGGLVIFSMVFPSNWFKSGFGYKGFLNSFRRDNRINLIPGVLQDGFFQSSFKMIIRPFNPYICGFIIGIVGLIIAPAF